jgi:4-hydroxy-2-oxoheptanedioate aldolase
LTWNTDPGTYSRHANDEILLLVQVETEESVSNIDEILSVAGVDGVFVGPNDLAFSGGKPWPDVWLKDEAYMALIDKVAHAVRGTGKFAGILARDAVQGAQMIARGYQFVGVGGDAAFLTAGSKQALEAVRTRAKP